MKCSVNAAAENDDKQEKIVIRVFGYATVHRESEVHLMKMLGEKVLYPQYIAGEKVLYHQCIAREKALCIQCTADDKSVMPSMYCR